MTYDLETKDPDKLVAKQKMKKTNHLTLHARRLPTNQPKTVILADVSSSMSGQKLNCLKDALHKVWRPNMEGIAFESELWAFEKADIDKLRTAGSTNMHDALLEGWKINPEHMVLITDGYADGGAEQILQRVRQHARPPIDTIGISVQGSQYDAELLREIAQLTGGRFMDVNEPLQLSIALQHLLDYRPESLQSGGSIQL